MANKPVIELAAMLTSLGITPSVAKQASIQIANPVAGALNEAFKGVNTKGLTDKLIKDLQLAKRLVKEINDLSIPRGRATFALKTNDPQSALIRKEQSGRALIREATRDLREYTRAQNDALRRLITLQQRTSAVLSSDNVAGGNRSVLQRQFNQRQNIIDEIVGGTSNRSTSKLNELGKSSRILDAAAEAVKLRGNYEKVLTRQTVLQANEQKTIASLLNDGNRVRESAIDKARKLLDLEKAINLENQKNAVLQSQKTKKNVSAQQVSLGGASALGQAQNLNVQQVIRQAQKDRGDVLKQAFDAEVRRRQLETGRTTSESRALVRRSIDKTAGGDTGKFFGVGGIGSFIPQEFGLSKISANTSIAQKSLKSITAANKELQTEINKTNKELSRNSVRFANAQVSAQKFGEQIGLAVRRYSAFLVGTSALYVVLSSIREATTEALKFEKAQTRLSQILGTNRANVKGIVDEARKASLSTGTASTETLKGVDILAQAGFQDPTQLKQTAELLSKVPLTATFGNVEETADGLIAVIQQFPEFNKQLTSNEKIFDLLNKTAADYAVEVKDIFEALKRGGSVLSETGAGFQESVELITLLRSRTREAAPTIGNFFKSIGFRLFRPQNQDVLNSLGVSSTNLPEALKQTSQGFADRFGQGNLQDNVEAIRLAAKIAGVYQGGRFLALMQAIQDDQGKFAQTLTGVPGSFSNESTKRLDDVAISFQRIQKSVDAMVSSVVGAGSVRGFFEFIANSATTISGVSQKFANLIPIIGGVVGALTLPGVLRRAGRGALSKFGAFGQSQRVLLAQENEGLNVLPGRVRGGPEIDIRGARRERFIRTGEQFNIADRARFSGLALRNNDERIAAFESIRSQTSPFSTSLGNVFTGTNFRNRNASGLGGLFNRGVRAADRSRTLRFLNNNSGSVGLGLSGAGLLASSAGESLTESGSIGAGAFLKAAGGVASVGGAAALVSGPAAPFVILGTALTALSAGIYASVKALSDFKKAVRDSADEENRRKNREAGVSGLDALLSSRQDAGSAEDFGELIFGKKPSAETNRALSDFAKTAKTPADALKIQQQVLKLLDLDSFDATSVARQLGSDYDPVKYFDDIFGSTFSDKAKEESRSALRNQVISLLNSMFPDSLSKKDNAIESLLAKATRNYIVSIANFLDSAANNSKQVVKNIGVLSSKSSNLKTSFERSELELPAFRNDKENIDFARGILPGSEVNKKLFDTLSQRETLIRERLPLLFNEIGASSIQSELSNVAEGSSTFATFDPANMPAARTGEILQEIFGATGLDQKEIVKTLIGNNPDREAFTKLIREASGLEKGLNSINEGITAFFNGINTVTGQFAQLQEQLTGANNAIRDNRNQQIEISRSGQLRTIQRNIELGGSTNPLLSSNSQEISRLRGGVLSPDIGSTITSLRAASIRERTLLTNTDPNNTGQAAALAGASSQRITLQNRLSVETDDLKNSLEDLSKSLGLAEENTDILKARFDALRGSLISAGSGDNNPLTSRQKLGVSNVLGFLGASGSTQSGLDLSTGRLRIPNGMNTGSLKDAADIFSSPAFAGIPLSVLTGGKDDSALGSIGSSLFATLGAERLAGQIVGTPGISGSKAEIQNRLETAMLDAFKKEEDSRKMEGEIRKETLAILTKLQEQPNDLIDQIKDITSSQAAIRDSIVKELAGWNAKADPVFAALNNAAVKLDRAAEAMAGNMAKAEIKITVDPMSMQIGFADKLLDVKFAQVKKEIAVAVEKSIRSALGVEINVQEGVPDDQGGLRE